jgi:hypothetical protein
MNVRDPKFTARLENALTILANQPTRSLSYLENRFELEGGDLQTWLDEFNGGLKTLRFDRIHAVKRELGGLTVTSAKAAAPAPVVPPPAAAKPEPRVERTATPAKPVVAVEIADDGQSPWETAARVFRQGAYRNWRPLFARAADQGYKAIAEQLANLPHGGEAFLIFSGTWLGQRRSAPEKIRRFLVWGDARCSAKAGEPRSAAESPAAPAAAAPAVADPQKSDMSAKKASAALAAGTVSIGGTTFEVELTIRLVPVAEVQT